MMRESTWSGHDPMALSASSGMHHRVSVADPYALKSSCPNYGRTVDIGGATDDAGMASSSISSLQAYGAEFSSSSGGIGIGGATFYSDYNLNLIGTETGRGQRKSAIVPLTSIRHNDFDLTTESSSINSTGNPLLQL
ncbi:unnamed protein product, partial [Anisakis simplex]|uniref:Homeobox protein araucan n=1 Tax=Anisakis simplex TaxID=6269 RepID=A0A0M3JEA7_ANISI